MAQINLGGSIGTTGVSILGNVNISISDANHTMSIAEYTNQFINITSGVSLTAQRNIVSPLTIGLSFIVKNATTGGQNIQFIGPSGTGVIVANGETVLVVNDGTNYYLPDASHTLSGDVTGLESSNTVTKLQGNIINSVAPTDQQVLTWDNTDGYWLPKNTGSVTTVSSSPYTVTSTDQVLLVDTTSARTIILTSNTAGAYAGRKIVIKDKNGSANTNNITIQPSPGGSGTFDGVSGNLVYPIQYGSLTLVLSATGSSGAWYII